VIVSVLSLNRGLQQRRAARSPFLRICGSIQKPSARAEIMLDHAADRGYGVPAFNINNMEQGLAIMRAASACDAPVILQASRGARSYAGDIMLRKMVEALAEMYPDIPIVHAPGPRQQRSDLPDGDPARLHQR
jgi:hypothetical protein